MIRLYLQSTTKTDKKYIKEAARIKYQNEALRKGWIKIGSGLNKVVYKKGQIVIKFAKRGKERYNQQEVDKYFSLTKYYRRYFARIFGGDDRKIIQRYIPIHIKPKYTGREYMLFDMLSNKLRVWDVSLHHNISIIDGRPVIYDFGCCGS